LCDPKIIAHYMHGKAENTGALFGGHASEVAHLHEASQVLVFGGEDRESVIKLDEIQQFKPGSCLQLDEGSPGVGVAPAALQSGSLSRVVHQNLPHDTGGDREKMDFIIKLAFGSIEELHVGLMDQRRGLEGMVRTLAPQVTAGDAVHLRVQRRHNLVEGGWISRAQPFE